MNAAQHALRELHGMHDRPSAALGALLGESHVVAGEHEGREPARRVEDFRVPTRRELQPAPRDEGSARDQIGLNPAYFLMIARLF